MMKILGGFYAYRNKINREQMYRHQGGKGRQGGLGDWDWHIYTIDMLYKGHNSWELTTQH